MGLYADVGLAVSVEGDAVFTYVTGGFAKTMSSGGGSEGPQGGSSQIAFAIEPLRLTRRAAA
jgi:hypothetical protein